jgi:hypothetical protein
VTLPIASLSATPSGLVMRTLLIIALALAAHLVAFHSTGEAPDGFSV